MFSIELGNRTKLSATIDLAERALRLEQRHTGESALPPQEILIPLTDLRRTAECVGTIVKFFRGASPRSKEE